MTPKITTEIQVGAKVELISEEYAKLHNKNLGIKGTVVSVVDLLHNGKSVGVLWNDCTSSHIAIIEEADPHPVLKILTNEELNAKNPIWFDAIRKFSQSEMRAFLELVAEQEDMGRTFCKDMCEHRYACEGGCKYPGSSYFGEFLKRPISTADMAYIKRKGKEYDSKDSD